MTAPRLASVLARLVVLCIACACGAVVIYNVARPTGGRPPGPPPGEEPLRPRTASFDDSGFNTSLAFHLPVRDPGSLEHIRDCFHNAGYRGIAQLQAELDRGGLSDRDRMARRYAIVQLLLYEGEAARAAEVLADLRARAERDPQFRQELSTLIFMQGVAALRRGETENCVACRCRGSCIFPIEPAAVHRRTRGARQAVGFFTEYLRHWPDDMGVRWLLNIAHMTLGEYPDGVPPEYRIPPSHFRSGADLGRFTDVAPQLGVDRFNRAGGAVMDDFDNDGLLDLLTTSSDPGMHAAFFRNRGDGTFEDRSQAAGLEGQLGGLYCVQTDYNNDGRLDLFICRGGWTGVPQRPSLLRNDGRGTFTDVTKAAGLVAPVDGQVAVWADYDNDGHVDLFVGGETVRSRLYHNRGDGTFEEVALAAGVANEGRRCKGAAWGDYDGDGYPDLFVSNLDGPDRLFHNNGDGTFTDVAPRLGLDQAHQGFACWFFDYDNDGRLDLFATSYERNLVEVVKSDLGLPHRGVTCRLYRNLGGGRFADVSAQVGLDRALAPMGCNFADFDNDGYLDIYLGTGTPAYSMLTPHRMFQNQAGARFVDVTTSSGTGHLQKGHAVACGDWDRDGNVDLFEQLGGAAPGDAFRNVLFQNPGHPNHWLTVKLVGVRTNRAAIGARIKVTPAGGPVPAVYRWVTSGSSFGGNPLQQTIGIGAADRIAALEVYWPTSRTTQTFRDVPVDQAIEVTEFASAYRPLRWTRLRVPPPE